MASKVWLPEAEFFELADKIQTSEIANLIKRLANHRVVLVL